MEFSSFDLLFLSLRKLTSMLVTMVLIKNGQLRCANQFGSPKLSSDLQNCCLFDYKRLVVFKFVEELSRSSFSLELGEC